MTATGKADWIDRAIAKYSGRFLNPVDGVEVNCPLHGSLGRSSPGGELFCPTCHAWFPAIPDKPLSGDRLAKKQAALQARLARRNYRANQGQQREARKQIRLNQIAKRAKRLGVDPDVLAALTPAQQQALEAGRRKRLEQSETGLEIGDSTGDS